MKEEIKSPQTSVGMLYNTTETYCVSCKKYIANENSSVRKAKQYRLMLSSNCASCVKKINSY